MKPPLRLLASAACLSAWMILLFVGWSLGGAVHLLFVASMALFPWRQARA